MPDLAKLVKENTRKRYDPFDAQQGNDLVLASSRSGARKILGLGVKAKGKGKAAAIGIDSGSAPSAIKRRRLIEDEAEVDDQLAVASPTSAAWPSEALKSPQIPPCTNNPERQDSGKTTSRLTSGLLAYGSDGDDDSD